MTQAITLLATIMGNYIRLFQLVAVRADKQSLAATLHECRRGYDDFDGAACLLSRHAGQEADRGYSINFLRRGLWLTGKYAKDGIAGLNEDFAAWLEQLRGAEGPIALELIRQLNDRFYDAIYFLPHLLLGVEVDLDLDQVSAHRVDQKWYPQTRAYTLLRQLSEAMGSELTTVRALLPFGLTHFGSNDQSRVRSHMIEASFSHLAFQDMGLTSVLDLCLGGYAGDSHLLLDDVKCIRFVEQSEGYTPYFDHQTPGKTHPRWNSFSHYLYFRGFCGNTSQNDLGVSEDREWLRQHRLLPPHRREFFDNTLWGGEESYCFAASDVEPTLYEFPSGSYEMGDVFSATQLLGQAVREGSLTPQFIGTKAVERLVQIPVIPMPM